jgi:hypothetical protein
MFKSWGYSGSHALEQAPQDELAHEAGNGARAASSAEPDLSSREVRAKVGSAGDLAEKA